MGRVKVPSITPETAVHSPDAILIGCSLNARIRGESELTLQVFNVIFDAFRRPVVGPVDGDVPGMTLAELIPLLTGIDVEIKVVEVDEIRLLDLLLLLDFGKFLLHSFNFGIVLTSRHRRDEENSEDRQHGG
jgi:hypothetical protein